MSMHMRYYLGPYVETHRRKWCQASATDLCIEMNDALMEDEIAEDRHAWLPNGKRDGQPRRFHIGNEEGEAGAVPLDDDDIHDRERDWFRMAYAPEIDALVAAYGVANVKVRWGLIWRWT